MSDAIIEFYKRKVDREALRQNLKLTVSERLQNFEAEVRRQKELEPPRKPSVTDDHPGWEAISDCGPNRTSDPIFELYKRDVDRTLLRENLRQTVSERFLGLARMAERSVSFRLGVPGNGRSMLNSHKADRSETCSRPTQGFRSHRRARSAARRA